MAKRLALFSVKYMSEELDSPCRLMICTLMDFNGSCQIKSDLVLHNVL